MNLFARAVLMHFGLLYASDTLSGVEMLLNDYARLV